MVKPQGRYLGTGEPSPSPRTRLSHCARLPRISRGVWTYSASRVWLLGGQSRAGQIEVSLNEDIKSKEERKMKQRQVQNPTRCAPRPHRQAPSSPVFVTASQVCISFTSLSCTQDTGGEDPCINPKNVLKVLVVGDSAVRLLITLKRAP